VTDWEVLAARLLQGLGHSPAPAQIDSEVGRMDGGGITEGALFTLLRYDLDFDAMAREGTISPDEAKQFQNFDAPEDMARLHEIAANAAAREVSPAHLAFPA
jgi:hypothetical protein